MSAVLVDPSGNRYWLDRRTLILKLVKPPKSGKQQRILGTVSLGILRISRIGEWELKRYGCWYINRFILMKHKEFGFNLVQFSGKQSDGKHVSGFFYPELLLDNRYIHYGTYEPQNKLTIDQLAKSPDDAKRMWEEAKKAREAEARVAEPPELPKDSEKPVEQSAQKGLFE
jgi:hypothetical protein